MKFSVLALSALLAFAAAETTTADASTTTSNPSVECAKQCEPTDTCCIAKCWNVPCPSDNQANDTNSCVAACPQGTGSPADAQKYADCEQSCYSSHFWGGHGPTATQSTSTSTATDATATETSSDASTTDTSKTSDNDNDDNSSSGSTNDSSDGTATSSSGFSTETNAAVKVGASAAGLFGLVAAAFAL
ncbi:hypothetical protein N7499_010334 [Penicillium canescens]|uniref:GPI anchored serine-threonine rich protein n=1 Tax=Penicillium canescens TaxID=5083 RepID=A0AAD6NCP3_PENCN|nr:uncharacterized protein N7446_005487 [Penicillium canescens]KAJ6050275.1 hypothetical protein N7444_006991 [Penicillium canescens]KAJ6050862.1 hypothetical protein N7460_001396 [Penicillium canescens]KAJ6061367.1 hypothetical protein N7446_005487 [Penicillium canescens]KAJ6068447.1 hypothetical protein N7499_010334 [Penicillium canescens]KAJ6183497.1 hypothetical protein N7485_002139 [Penicillium canescens]